MTTWTLPTLEECAGHGIEPMEFRVLVAPAVKPEKVGSILLTDATKERENFATRKARVIAVGDIAFTNPDRKAPPQVGDVVLVMKFVGADAEIEGADGRKYRLVNDRDIEAVIERAVPQAQRSAA